MIVDVTHAPTDRSQRRLPIADLCRLPADNLIDGVIDHAEEPGPAVRRGGEAGRVHAPHLVGTGRDDGPGVHGIAIRRPGAPRRQQPVGAHQSQDALAAEVETAEDEARALSLEK